MRIVFKMPRQTARIRLSPAFWRSQRAIQRESRKELTRLKARARLEMAREIAAFTDLESEEKKGTKI